MKVNRTLFCGAALSVAALLSCTANASYLPFVTGHIKPKQLSVVDLNQMPSYEQALVATAQGLIAKRSHKQLYTIDSGKEGFDEDGTLFWLNRLHIPHRKTQNIWRLLSQHHIQHYILYDGKSSPASLNIATSLAGLLNAVPIDKSLQSEADANGLRQIKDVSNWSYPQLLKSRYAHRFNRKFAVELNPTTEYGTMRDYAVAHNAIVFYSNLKKNPDGTYDNTLREQVMAHLQPGSAIIGWGPTDSSGERNFIDNVGKQGNFYVAADHGRNVSVYSQLQKLKRVRLNRHQQPAAIIDTPQTKYVSFIVSDGDNFQWTINRGNDVRWWGSLYRGTFPIGWTISPSTYRLAPNIWNYMGITQTNKDQFIVGPSGIGYVFGSADGTHGFNKQLRYLNRFVKNTGINTISIFGNGDWDNYTFLSGYTQLSHVRGAFYFEYEGWISAESGYNTQFIDGKPVIPTNEYLNDQDGARPIDVSDDIINNYKNDGIYAVYVNAWSGGLDTLDKTSIALIKQTIDKLKQSGQDIKVVSPQDLITVAIQRHQEY